MNKNVLGWCVVAAVFAGACEANMADVPEMDGFDPDASVAVEKTEQALGMLLDDEWHQGEAPVDMGSAADLFCWLTEIRGHFQGGGEVVKVFVENGRWKLGGSSAQTGVYGKARCTPVRFQNGRVLNVTTEKSWDQSKGTAKTFLAVDDGFTACMLTRVAGHFEGAGEAVEITRENGEWRLGGRSRQSGVAAGARCISSVFVSQGTATHSADCEPEACQLPPWGCYPAFCWGNPPPTDLGPREAPPELWGPSVNIACGLGKMSGKFKGGAEYTRIFLGTGGWKLETRGRQDSTYSTSAFCFL